MTRTMDIPLALLLVRRIAPTQAGKTGQPRHTRVRQIAIRPKNSSRCGDHDLFQLQGSVSELRIARSPQLHVSGHAPTRALSPAERSLT